MKRLVSPIALACTIAVSLCFSPEGALADEIKVKGLAEWRRGDVLIVEGQRVRAHSGTRFKGRDISSLDSIPLGFEVEAKGERQADGVILTREIEAKPNGEAMFEGDVRDATNEIEGLWLRAGRMFEPQEDGTEQTVGRVVDSGPRAERMHRIMRQLVPPHVDYDRDIRVHVIDTPEWNAAAMGNGAIWVYTGLIDSMSDDELAVVLGHELAHYTHEHSRRQAKSNMWRGLLGVGAAVAIDAIKDETAQAVAMVAAGLGMTVWGSGYSRDLEDQADRVGLRYAHEGGFDVGAGVPLWGKFRSRYGESDQVTNFFFGSHSRPSDRIRNIEGEMDLNYRDASRVYTGSVPFRPAPSMETVTPTPSSDSEWVRQVEDQLASFGERVGDRFSPTTDPTISELRQGSSVVLELRVERDREMVVIGVCDSDCDDLDLVATDRRGREVEVDVEDDDYPVLQFVSAETATWRLEVRMPGCSADTCVFGIQSFVRR